jgi:hypothetical protein
MASLNKMYKEQKKDEPKEKYNEWNIKINGENSYGILGTYETKERALAILDEIQFYVCKGRDETTDIYKQLENQKKLLRNGYAVYTMPVN